MESGGTRAEGLATSGPRDGVEVWTVCLDCRKPVRLLGRDWHHEDGERHEARPDLGEQPRVEAGHGHAYALAALLDDRSRRSALVLESTGSAGRMER
jgi:uncharacterized protein affecting Mg2+/Co2+ transport